MKLQSIQALRGIAVLLVFYYHFSNVERSALLSANATETPLIAGLWTNGFAGVDLFFVISGFVMVYATGRASNSLKTVLAFLFARIGRIYPLWWIFVLLMMVYFYWIYGEPLNIVDTEARDESPSWHIIASIFLFPQNDEPILPVGWSLVHEVYFYTVFSLALLVVPRFRALFLLGWASLVLVGLFLGLSRPFANNVLTLVVHPLTLEFIAGAGAAWLVVNGRRWRPALISLLALILLVVALSMPFRIDEEMLLWRRVLLFGIPTALLVYGAVSLDIAGRIQWPTALVDLGNWSYAFYLSHILAIKGTEVAFNKISEFASRNYTDTPQWAGYFELGAPGYTDNLSFFAGSLISAILLSWFTYRFVERPLLIGIGKIRSDLFPTSQSELRPSPIRASVW